MLWKRRNQRSHDIKRALSSALRTHVVLTAAVISSSDSSVLTGSFPPLAGRWTFTDPCQESPAEPDSGHWRVPMQEVWHLEDPA